MNFKHKIQIDSINVEHYLKCNQCKNSVSSCGFEFVKQIAYAFTTQCSPYNLAPKCFQADKRMYTYRLAAPNSGSGY